MNRFFVFLIYNLLLPVVLIAGFPRFLIKGLQRGGLARNFRQRIGLYRPETRARLARPGNVWIHAVSVGEVLVALKIVEELLQQRPETGVVLSTTTTTGFALAEEKTAGDRDRITVIHNPVDLPWVTSAALRLIRPERLILVEAEVWPNLVRQARSRGIPVVLVNARLSDRSERRFRAFGAVTRPIFSLIDRVGVPFEGDIDRWAGLGIPRERIVVTGSVKFDEDLASRPEEQIAALRGWLTDCGIDPGSRILLAGSTHAGEEALIGRAWLELRERFPDLAYVVVPRHAERAAAVAADLRTLGMRPVLKVPLPGEPGETAAGAPAVGIANTTGELRAWFYLADVVVIGKSLLGHGGQNPVEPIVAGRPVIVGPNMENFRSIVTDLLAREGLVQIGGSAELAPVVAEWLAAPDRAAALARRGQEALERHRGATRRTVDWVLK
jgi:3-deoxy-D-manno-octulosonic-acid transferase